MTIQFFVPIFGVKKSVVAWLEIILNKPNNVNTTSNSVSKDVNKSVDGTNDKDAQNIQNNIKLLPYKDIDLSTLREKDIIKCLNHSNICVPQLIKMIHLNPKKHVNVQIRIH